MLRIWLSSNNDCEMTSSARNPNVACVGLGAKLRWHHLETWRLCWIIWWLYTNEFYFKWISSDACSLVMNQCCLCLFPLVHSLNHCYNGECMKFSFWPAPSPFLGQSTMLSYSFLSINTVLLLLLYKLIIVIYTA